MGNWQYDLLRGMDLLGIMLVFSNFNDIFKVFVKPELEKKLGRRLTDWDWQAYLRELDKKAEFEAQQKMRRERKTRMNDLKTIHDFVWNDSEGKSV
jgi:hypothetical protein